MTDGAEPHDFGEFKVLHVATPETPTTSHYFWGWTRTFGLGDDALTDSMTAMLYSVFLEDKSAIEAQELSICDDEERTDFSAAADAPALRGRHVLEAMMDAERNAPVLAAR